MAYPVHPGEILAEEVLPRYKLNVTEAAARLNVARPGFNNVLNSKRAVTPELALKIERVFGYPARMLLAMQAAFDLASAKHDEALIAKLDRMERVPENMA
ncbi:HigA family addiction module antidote protein [Polymorphobacter sp. PAMC 29334]|uniref:HigA family addiction module antitoxin n=1 Tax=Polymorphobacter sp. PAMC 29334 TaxID=2862331 RepID=UPI001C743E17|nr:HigA family addiction module antitoxin [Polymorphobacter sp. PAMC 29334]QYE36469.1 HigA family addiction module antidote protein [Polymorphobacter sp. PAMC 29334]